MRSQNRPCVVPPGADEVPAIHMANMSMLQLAEHSRGQLDPSTMRFERIEGALDAVENKIDRLLGNGYEVRPRDGQGEACVRACVRACARACVGVRA